MCTSPLTPLHAVVVVVDAYLSLVNVAASTLGGGEGKKRGRGRRAGKKGTVYAPSARRQSLVSTYARRVPKKKRRGDGSRCPPICEASLNHITATARTFLNTAFFFREPKEGKKKNEKGRKRRRGSASCAPSQGSSRDCRRPRPALLGWRYKRREGKKEEENEYVPWTWRKRRLIDSRKSPSPPTLAPTLRKKKKKGEEEGILNSPVGGGGGRPHKRQGFLIFCHARKKEGGRGPVDPNFW